MATDTGHFSYVCLQFVIFGLVTVLSLIFIRKFAKKALFKNVTEKTNLDSYIEKKFKVVEFVEDMAYIKINGISYAVSDEDEKLKLGDWVIIKEFKGNKAVVEKQKEKEL